MEVRYSYQAKITLIRGARKTSEYIPAIGEYGRRSIFLDFDICDLVETETDPEDTLIHILYRNLDETKIAPFIDKEKQKRSHVIITNIQSDIDYIEVYSKELEEWVDINDYLEETVDGFCV
jgi:hypothetical protein